MRATTATALRKNLAAELDKVEDDREPLIIVRTGGKPPAVLMSLEEFGSWEATEYLLRSPENATRLREAMAQFEAGGGTERKLAK